ncbi:MAG: IPTL-CTERM sorting domain-containing protein [candidate division Zixibacteria bacterium]
MRKTLLLTAVIILVAGNMSAWAGKEDGVNSLEKSLSTDELISNIAPDQVLHDKIAAEEAGLYEQEQVELARKEALLATQPKRVGVSASNVDPDPSAGLSDQEKLAIDAEAMKSRGELPIILNIECPEGATPEGEGCGNDTNGGCNSNPEVFGSIDCGETICGSAFATGSLRDTDWYRVNITEPRYITITVCADFPFVFGMNWQTGPEDCDQINSIDPFAYGEAGDTVSITTVQPLISGWPAIVFVAPESWEVISPCNQGDTTYWVSVTCETMEPGACCYVDPDPNCDNLSHVDCDALEGLWTEGTDCASFECPPPPANDLCVNAQPVAIPSSTPGTTILATGDDTESCGTGGNSYPGVWYSIIGNGREVTASTCNDGMNWDTKIQVWCNSCDYPVCVGGNDDDCIDYSYASTVTWCAERDVEYLILVYPYEINSGGDFILDITRGQPCSNPPDCAPPLGACCFGDRLDPSCDDAAGAGITEEECYTQHTDVLNWAEGALCADEPTPCPPACTIECPVNGILEAEACGQDSNGGCNADPYPPYPESFEQIACGDTICGTSWAIYNESKDTDWYRFTTASSQVITVTAEAEFPLRVIFFHQIDPDNCTDYSYVMQAVNECETNTIVYEVPGAGEYWVWIGPSGFYDMPCDETGEYFNDYWFTVTCEDPPLGACCNDETSECTENVARLDCQAPLRWAANTLCADLIPECGLAFCEGAIYSNGEPEQDLNRRSLAHCNPETPYFAGRADDFELQGTGPVTITGVAAGFQHWRPGDPDFQGTPANYEGVNVTIYATDPSDNAPGGEPLTDCSHQDNMGGDGIIGTVYLEQGEFTYTDLTAEYGFQCWMLDLPVNITVDTNTKYWLEILPVMLFSVGGQSGWLHSDAQNGEFAMGFAPLHYNHDDWTSMGVDNVFCLFADQVPLSGACCSAEGACQEMTEEDCISAGHEWLGAETVCLGDNNDNGIDDACESQDVPALSEWGVIILALLLLASGTVAVIRRRRVVAISE